MNLRALELAHVGRFRDPVRLGPFHAGLNLLVAPNESGKTTAVRALARALFDRHTTRGEELKVLQPAGTDLAPRVAVEFEVARGRFRLEKTFLQSPRSRLQQWQSGGWTTVAEADAADQRVQALLQSTLPWKGATRPEHWGLFGFLWARQGEPLEWPSWDDGPVGQSLRARLARVELDAVVEQVRLRCADRGEVILTSTGQARVGGPLRKAEEDLASIESGLEAIRRKRQEQEAVMGQFRQAEARVLQLEREHAEREQAAASLRQEALKTEGLRGRLEALEQALAMARDRLMAVGADAEMLGRWREELEGTRATLEQAESAERRAAEQRTARTARMDETLNRRRQAEVRLASLRSEAQRLRSLQHWRRLTRETAALEQQVARARGVADQLRALESRRLTVPQIPPKSLRELETLTETVRSRRLEIAALGLTVELTPTGNAEAVIQEGISTQSIRLPAGEVTRLQRPQSLDLHLPGWGRMVVRSGSRDVQEAAEELETLEKTRLHLLQTLGVADLQAAREAVAQAHQLEVEIRSAQATLTAQVGDHRSLEALQEAAALALRQRDALAERLAPTEAELAVAATELEFREAKLDAEIPAAEREVRDLDAGIEALRQEERLLGETWQDSQRRIAEARVRLQTRERQVSELEARHPDGLEASRKSAQLAFGQAEARVVTARSELPAEFEKLPERTRRAAAALQQVDNELQAQRALRDQARGRLEAFGGEGLYSRETELEEKRTEALLRRDAARTEGWCARLAHDLIERRQRLATQAVLDPLERRLTAAFAELTGDTSRRVFLDSGLQIAGVGRTREDRHGFAQLSQGAKEQLLLCLRLAVAQELASDEPQVLILDDVLVNTDPVRQERILDVLQAQGERLQILLLTCHPDRYRGVGRAVELGSGVTP